MTQLSEIKDKVAVNNGYADWLNIDNSDLEQHEIDAIKADMINQIANEYADVYCAEKVREVNERMNRELDRLAEEKKTITKFYEMQHIENISDLKAVRDMILPFKNDFMTHREKTYLANKFTSILDNKIMDKVDRMHRSVDFSEDDNLPF